MNERINELIKEVGTDVSGKWVGIDNAKLLAELVVKDCLAVIETSAEGEPNNSEAQAALLACALDILEHFDMEMNDDFN